MKYKVILSSAVLLAASLLHGQAVDESALFGDTATVTQGSQVADTGSIVKDEKKLGFSGSLTSAYTVFIPNSDRTNPVSMPSITATGLLDARLIGGIKGFISTQATYTPSGDSASFTIPEAFVDVNFGQKVYLRTGRQLLQWGRCQLWNPTDLINTDRKQFVQKLGLRNGAYGIKAHVPFGTSLNFYGFADFRGADTLNNIAGAFKTEFTVKTSEMAVEVWGKKGKMPDFGYDFSSRVAGIDIAGEALLFRMDNELKATIDRDSNLLDIQKGDAKWNTRLALNLSRSFDVNGVPDRLMLSLEGYYNGTGYDKNFISDAVGATGKPGQTLRTPIDYLRRMPIQYFSSNGLYRPNELSKYYVALFSSVQRFITSSYTLSFNAISNVEQRCAYIAGSLAYADLRDFSLGLTISGGVGPEDTEYTMTIPGSPMGVGMTVQLTAGINF